MWTSIAIGSLLLIITILIHAFATRIAIYISNKHHNVKIRLRFHLPATWVALVVLWMFFVSIFESVIWALAYMYSGAIENYVDALYFSIVTFTTLGYGDITLSEDWRLLSSFQASIGIIVFGWSTAIVMAVVQNVYFRKSNSRKE